jgi:protein-S-isoprenylcysteine O-methyltransferase Ste14
MVQVDVNTMLSNRVPPPVVTMLIALAMWASQQWVIASEQHPRPLWRSMLVLLALALAGAFGAPAIRAFRRAGTTVSPTQIHRATALVSNGIYRVTRNPMYVAFTFVLIAWVLWLGSASLLVGPVALVLWLTVFQIKPEENALKARFGDEYDAYCRRVRRWL